MWISKKVTPPNSNVKCWPPTISATRRGYFFRSPLEWLTWPFFFWGGIYVIPPSKRLGLSGAKAQNRDWLPETWQSCETLRILEVNHWPPILGCHKFTQNIHVRLIWVNLVDLLCLFCFTWICFTSFISNIIISTWCFVSSFIFWPVQLLGSNVAWFASPVAWGEAPTNVTNDSFLV